jgi:two-component system, cell cycle sensor histidine kinase DivJ
LADPSTPEDRSTPDPALSDALRWHGAWAAMVLSSLLALVLAFRGFDPPDVAAMMLAASPGLAALALYRRDGPRARAGLIALWAIGGAAACMLTGGVTGPLAPWCLAPLAAAAVFGSRRLFAQAGALALLAGAAAALGQLAGLSPGLPLEGPAFWMSLISLLTTGVGLGSGLILALRRQPAQAPTTVIDAESARLLDDQPQLVVSLNGVGEVSAVHGERPQGLRSLQAGANLLDLATQESHEALQGAFSMAAVVGRGEADFTPMTAPDRVCSLNIKRSANGRFAAVIRDATEERWREAELQRARAEAEALNTGKSRFLANMSHELRTPLNAVMGFSDVMKSRLFGDLSPRYQEYAELIHESGRHLLDLINDVLDMSKIEADKYQLSLDHFDARDAISGALRLVRMQADTAGISLRGQLPAEPLDVDADKRAMKQIVLNLVSNALKFTPKGGAITVSAEARGDELVMAVADSGVGIAPEDVERLGRPYEQAGDSSDRARGTGLGLSLVRAFSELHGGSMKIESVLGEGTTVIVRLPVLQRAVEPPHAGNVIAFTR